MPIIAATTAGKLLQPGGWSVPLWRARSATVGIYGSCHRPPPWSISSLRAAQPKSLWHIAAQLQKASWIFQTLSRWQMNPRLWLQASLEAGAAHQGQAPKNLSAFLPKI